MYVLQTLFLLSWMLYIYFFLSLCFSITLTHDSKSTRMYRLCNTNQEQYSTGGGGRVRKRA